MGENMDLNEVLFGYYSVAVYLEFCLRLVLAFVAGGVIGFERSHRFKEAGIRTHIIVCCTAALIMLISKYGFADLGQTGNMEYYGSKGADTARVAAQAVSGISFLCAGVIIKVGGNIRGLTTAAGIWMTASLGLAIGAGMYVVSGCMLLIVIVLQYGVYRVKIGPDAYDGYRLNFVVRNLDDFEAILSEQITAWGAQVTESNITWVRDDKAEFDYVVRRAEEIRYKDIKQFADKYEEIVSFIYSPMQTHIQ